MSRLRVVVALQETPIEVGELAWVSGQRRAALQLSRTFRDDPWPISPLRLKSSPGPILADPATFEGLHGVFADCLPDGWGRLLVDREAQARGVPAGALTPVDRLAIVGAHGMGALTFEPAQDGWGADSVDLEWFAETAARIEAGATVADLQRIRDLNGGSAGARPKLVAHLNPTTGELADHRQPLEPGFEPWLVKFRNRSDPPCLPEIELAYMTMARAAGIATPHTKVLRDAEGRSFLGSKRFDRRGADRLHMHSAAGLLDLDFRVPSLDYDNLLKLIGVMTRDIHQIEEGVRRMAFNVMAHNRDDHAKNHAFLMGADRTWRLSPAFDVTFSAGPAGEHHLAIAGEGRRPTQAHLLVCAKAAGLSPAVSARILDEVRAVVERWEEFADAAEVPAEQARMISEAIEGVGLVRVDRRMTGSRFGI